MTLLLAAYNLAVISTLATYLLWLNKSLSVEALLHLWQR
jgi:hypothetical protein